MKGQFSVDISTESPGQNDPLYVSGQTRICGEDPQHPPKTHPEAIDRVSLRRRNLKVLQTVDLKKKEGFRYYTLLHLLYDSGARASEIATLNLDYFNPQQKTLAILGKRNRYRLIELWPKTVQLLQRYIAHYRITPKLLYQHRLFINQRGKEFTRHGIYRLCTKYLSLALPAKRLKHINPVHSFRHSRAVNMLYGGSSLSDIRNHLGHEDIQSTTVYLHLDLNRKRQIQKQFMEYTQSVLIRDPKIEALFDGENKEDLMSWLDSL